MSDQKLHRKSTPTYHLEVVHQLVDQGRVTATGRVTRELLNHGYFPSETINAVLLSLAPNNFVEGYELEKRRGTVADVYKVDYDEVEWYVKFFLDDAKELHIELWSMHWW